MNYEYKLIELVDNTLEVESYINDAASHGWRVHTLNTRIGNRYDITKILFERAR